MAQTEVFPQKIGNFRLYSNLCKTRSISLESCQKHKVTSNFDYSHEFDPRLCTLNGFRIGEVTLLKFGILCLGGRRGSQILRILVMKIFIVLLFIRKVLPALNPGRISEINDFQNVIRKGNGPNGGIFLKK